MLIKFLRSKEEGGGGTSEEIKNPTLTQAIEQSLKNLEPKEEKPEEKEAKKEVSKEVVKEEKPEEETPEEPSKEDIERALSLLKLIQDPKTSKETVALLAKEVGLTPDATKEEKKEATKSLEDIFKAELGADLEFMAPGLFKAVQKVIAAAVSEATAPITKDISESKAEKQSELISSSFDKMENEYKNFKELEPEINKLIDTHKPRPGQNPEAYFKELFFLAAGEKGVSTEKAKAKPNEKPATVVVDINKARKNQNDATSRLASERTTSEDIKSSGEIQTKGLSLKNAVSEAVKQVQEKLAKA